MVRKMKFNRCYWFISNIKWRIER